MTVIASITRLLASVCYGLCIEEVLIYAFSLIVPNNSCSLELLGSISTIDQMSSALSLIP